MAHRSLGHRAPLLWLVLPLMAGLSLGKLGENSSVTWLLASAAVLVGASGLAAMRNWNVTWAVTLCSGLLAAGVASYALHRPRLPSWEHLPGREITLTLHVDRVFAKADPRKAAGLATILHAPPHVTELAGQPIYFSFSERRVRPPPIRGEILTAVGVLAPLPGSPAINTFDGFLASAGINFRFARGHVLKVEKAAPPYRRFCAWALERFSAWLGSEVNAKRPELVGVYRAMLLGQQHELNDEQLARFRQSGTMHVFSISGLHIAVIAGSFSALLLLARVPRMARLVIGLVSLWLYVDLTGAAPSAIRAYAMVAFVQVSLTLRVPRNPFSALVLSAFSVLLASPLDLFSASFQMSYGIVAALLLLGLPLADTWLVRLALFRDLPKATWRWHHHLRDWTWRLLVGAVAIGFASALVGAITGAEFFNLFTPGALIVNLWVIPASTLVIVFGFAALLAGLAHLAGVLALANHAAVLVLWIIDWGVRENLRLPAMCLEATFRAPWLGGVALVTLTAVLLAGYAARWRGWARGFWPPFATVAVFMIFGIYYGPAGASNSKRQVPNPKPIPTQNHFRKQ